MGCTASSGYPLDFDVLMKRKKDIVMIVHLDTVKMFVVEGIKFFTVQNIWNSLN